MRLARRRKRRALAEVPSAEAVEGSSKFSFIRKLSGVWKSSQAEPPASRVEQSSQETIQGALQQYYEVDVEPSAAIAQEDPLPTSKTNVVELNNIDPLGTVHENAMGEMEESKRSLKRPSYGLLDD